MRYAGWAAAPVATRATAITVGASCIFYTSRSATSTPLPPRRRRQRHRDLVHERGGGGVDRQCRQHSHDLGADHELRLTAREMAGNRSHGSRDRLKAPARPRGAPHRPNRRRFSGDRQAQMLDTPRGVIANAPHGDLRLLPFRDSGAVGYFLMGRAAGGRCRGRASSGAQTSIVQSSIVPGPANREAPCICTRNALFPHSGFRISTEGDGRNAKPHEAQASGLLRWARNYRGPSAGR